MTEVVELFGGSTDGISEEALVTSSGASVSSSGDGFQSGGCPPGGTCTDLELRWIGAIDIDKRSESGAVRLYKGFVSHYWLVPDRRSGGDLEGTGADGRTYDFLSSRAELTPEVGNAVLCSRKNLVTRARGASPAILANYPSAVTTAVSPDTANTLTLSARGFSVSHQFTTAQGHIQGVYDPAVPSFTGTWVFGGQCSGTTTPDGVALDSGIAYVYELDDPAVAVRGYTFAGKTRRIETNGAAIPCGFLCF